MAAVGGDGTVLTALRAAATTGSPVLGIACGSLGALSAVRADDIERALEAFESGNWTPRRLPCLAVTVEDEDEPSIWAINDMVLVRKEGQLEVDASVGDELYARMTGDGVVVATSLGSSAYSMAAGGPVLAAGTDAMVLTPLVVHGGSIPPLVVPGECALHLLAIPGWSGFSVEVDGHEVKVPGTRFTVRLQQARAALVTIGDPGRGLTQLRERGVITDSPRVLARDARAKAAKPA